MFGELRHSFSYNCVGAKSSWRAARVTKQFITQVDEFHVCKSPVYRILYLHEYHEVVQCSVSTHPVASHVEESDVIRAHVPAKDSRKCPLNVVGNLTLANGMIGTPPV